MRRMRLVPPAAVAVIGALILFAALTARAQHYVPTADPAHPRLKFADSLISPNDRCVVSHDKLNPRVRPVYVNGVPMGFC
jgi:hypothetical protein